MSVQFDIASLAKLRTRARAYNVNGLLRVVPMDVERQVAGAKYGGIGMIGVRWWGTGETGMRWTR